jgi:hypothetical protein
MLERLSLADDLHLEAGVHATAFRKIEEELAGREEIEDGPAELGEGLGHAAGRLVHGAAEGGGLGLHAGKPEAHGEEDGKEKPREASA